MKKTAYLVSGALLALLMVWLYVGQDNRPQSSAAAQIAPPTPKIDNQAQTQKVIGTIETAKAPIDQAPLGNIIPLTLQQGESPADFALIDILRRHPDLKISPKEAADLQDLFSTHYKRFAAFQAKVAVASRLVDGSTQIQIPAFPKQGKQMADDLLADINAYYTKGASQALTQAIGEAYQGYTNRTGQLPLTLSVRVSVDPNYSYDVTRQTIFIDQASGKVIGTGFAKDTVTKSKTTSSPYAELLPLFPKAPRG